MQRDQEPDRYPERGREHHVAVVQEQQDLEDRRRNPVPRTVMEVAVEVAHEGLVEAVVQILRLNPHGEDEVLGRGLVRPEGMSARANKR